MQQAVQAPDDTGLSKKARKLPAGEKVVFGDFVGDKRPDTAVGNTRHPSGESPEPKKHPGRVTVHHDKEPDTPHRIEGRTAGDGFGCVLSPADVDGDGRDDLAVGQVGRLGSHSRITVLHGSDEGLGSKPCRSTKRGTSAGDPKNEHDAQLHHAGDFDGDGKDEIGLADDLADPKFGFWYTDGTKNDDAKFSTAKFRP